MGTTSTERSALEELAAARLRGAKPEELLELAEAAIEQANAVGDSLTLESVAAELDSAAATHSDQGDDLRLRLAGRRARATSQIVTAVPAAEDGSVPVVAKAAFWVTATMVVLALILIGAMARGSYGAAYFLMFLVVLGSLVVAVLGVVGFVQSVRANSGLGMLMSAIPCGIVLLLIGVRIALSL